MLHAPHFSFVEMSVTSVVRLKRCNGAVVQDCDVYIGRQCTMGGWRLPKSKWHNPFSVPRDGTPEQVGQKFEHYITTNAALLEDLGELQGKVLGCWCAPRACHGHILARLADSSAKRPKTEHVN